MKKILDLKKIKNTNIANTPEKELICEILVSAIEDYKTILISKQDRIKIHGNCFVTKKSVENFLDSDWCYELEDYILGFHITKDDVKNILLKQ